MNTRKAGLLAEVRLLALTDSSHSLCVHPYRSIIIAKSVSKPNEKLFQNPRLINKLSVHGIMPNCNHGGNRSAPVLLKFVHLQSSLCLQI